MKTHLLLLIPFFIILHLQAQEKSGIIYPGNHFLNKSHDTLFYLPKQKIETLMVREELSNALIQSLNARNAESDSLLCLKTREAGDWYSKLIETDKLLEATEVLRVQERHKARRKTKICFGLGVVAGFAVGAIL
jgi:hypothetical protein